MHGVQVACLRKAQEQGPTLCRVMAFWKPLYAVLASKDASEALDSSKAITSWPRAAAASEK